MRAEGSPKSRSELRTLVGSDDVWYTKTSNPMRYQGGDTVIGSGGGQRNSLRPSGGLINDGEKGGMTRGGRERTCQVNVNVGKTRDWKRNDRWAKVSMTVDIARLTGETGMAPVGNAL